MNNLQIALNGDKDEVVLTGKDENPEQKVGLDQQAVPVAGDTTQIGMRKLQRVGYGQHETAQEIEDVLVKY